MADIKKIIDLEVNNSDANKSIDNTNKKLQQTSKEQTEITQKTGNLKTSFSSLGDTLDGVTGGAVSSFKGMLGGVKGLTGGFKGLRGAIIATGLGALVVVVTTLVQYFSKFDAATKLVSQTMAGLTGFVDGIINNFNKLLELDIVGFFNGVTDSVQEGVEATGRMIDAQRELQNLNTSLLTQNANLNVELEKQKKILEDTTLSFDERRQAQERVNEITEQLLVNEKERLTLEKEIAQQNLRTAGSEQEIRDAKQQVAEADAELIEVTGQLDLERQEAAKKLREINEQETAQSEANTKAEKARLKEIRKANQKLAEDEEKRLETIRDLQEKYDKELRDLQVESNAERIELQRQRALDELNSLEATETEKQNLIKAINAKFDEEQSQLEEEKLEREKEKELTRLQEIQTIRDEYATRIEERDAVTELEKKELALEKEKEEALAELERLEATEAQKAEVIKYYQDEVTKAQEDANKQQERDTKIKNEALVSSSLQAAEAVTNALEEGSDLAKGVAIAQTLWNTYQGISAGVALGFPAAIPAVAFATATGFGAVANILSTDVGSNGGGTGSGGTGTPMRQPNFNTVGDTRQSALDEAQADAKQEPTQAYVVSTEVSSQQSLDRNRIKNSTFLG